MDIIDILGDGDVVIVETRPGADRPEQSQPVVQDGMHASL